MIEAQVGVSKEFMESYSRLPRKIQKKTREFLEKFQSDPTQPGLNFERISGAADDKVRSVRVDQAYRAIVIHPPKGDVFLCVWVDHHDDAYAWVRNRRFEVNPRSGLFQMFDFETAAQPASEVAVAEAEPAEEGSPPLFGEHDDEDLLLAGVPEPLLASVRALGSERELDALAPHLPADASDMLYQLAAGYSLIEAMEEVDRSKAAPPGPVDTEDFRASLELPQSQEHFKLVADPEELEGILDAPLDQWRIFLHPAQRRLIRMKANGPVRVLGGAGTGKTVVLMHRANYLASEIFTGPTDRLLVTTYTRNLALDLQMNLKNLCSKAAFARIEVSNLHSWAASFMRKQGHQFRIVDPAERRTYFESAHAGEGAQLPLAFYMEEWEQVVQAQEVATRDEYLTARRTGRGTRLSRRQRAEVWEVLNRYRELLRESGRYEWDDVIRETRLYLEKQSITLPYNAVLADEVQDFTASELLLLRALAPQKPNSLFLVGDGHQRIYGQPVRLGHCGIEIRGRSRRLKVNYRTTERIRNRAVAVLANCEIDDLDGGVDSLRGFKSLRPGVEPSVELFARESQEAERVIEIVRAWAEDIPAENICIVARTAALIRDRYQPMLEQAGFETTIVERDPEGESAQPGIRLATMHRLKGLEFSRVLLAGVHEGVVPLAIPQASLPDDASRAAHEQRERCLFYVAATRARDALAVTGFGSESRFLA